MENQGRHLSMKQRNEVLKLLKKPEELFHGTLGTGNISIRLLVNRGYEANMLAAIPCTKDTQGNFQKGG